MTDQLSRAAGRARRWKFEAGTTELALGGLLLSAALALLLPRMPIFALTIFVPGTLLTGALVTFLERRYVTPRIGYLEYRENTRRGVGRWLLMLIASLLVLGGIMALLYRFHPETTLAWVTPLLALYIGAVMILYAVQMRLRRLLLLGLISAAFGLILSPLGLGRRLTDGLFEFESLGWYLLAMGVTFLFSGECAFRAFLRRNPVTAEAPDER
jgi:hypothetical protein